MRKMRTLRREEYPNGPQIKITSILRERPEGHSQQWETLRQKWGTGWWGRGPPRSRRGPETFSSEPPEGAGSAHSPSSAREADLWIRASWTETGNVARGLKPLRRVHLLQRPRAMHPGVDGGEPGGERGFFAPCRPGAGCSVPGQQLSLGAGRARHLASAEGLAWLTGCEACVPRGLELCVTAEQNQAGPPRPPLQVGRHMPSPLMTLASVT